MTISISATRLSCFSVHLNPLGSEWGRHRSNSDSKASRCYGKIGRVSTIKTKIHQIFATVSSSEKKTFLISTFGLDENCIFPSRDSSFVQAIMDATSGRGVDVILNFLTGDLLHDSWRCWAELGRFIEIGKRDILDGGKLDMEIFNRGATFTAFDLSTLYYSGSEASRVLWQK